MADTPFKVAVIDDEEQILVLLKKYLENTGKFDVMTFNDSKEGLDSVLADDYDVVLADIMMPKMDGIEILNAIKEKKPGCNVIMMTAFSALDRVIKKHNITAEHYIMKPFDSLEQLEEKILHLTNK